MAEFRPNVTPRRMFREGAFGGTYWRPIQSGVTGKRHSNAHKRIKALQKLPSELLTSPKCNPKLNKFGVASGTSLEYWESKGWIKAQDPYGWVQWYCRYAEGRRSPDDQRQIDRWQKIAGPNGRFRRRLANMVYEAGTTADDEAISPKIRQTLWQWGVELTDTDVALARKRAKSTKTKPTKTKSTKPK